MKIKVIRKVLLFPGLKAGLKDKQYRDTTCEHYQTKMEGPPVCPIDNNSWFIENGFERGRLITVTKGMQAQANTC